MKPSKICKICGWNSIYIHWEHGVKMEVDIPEVSFSCPACGKLLNESEDHIYVLLFWFWEGDSNLVNSYVGVSKTLDSTLKLYKEDDKLLGGSIIFLPGIKIPEEGQYGSDSFYQIVEDILR